MDVSLLFDPFTGIEALFEYNSGLLLTKPLLRALLCLVGGVGVVQRSLKTTSNVVGVLVSTGRRYGARITTVLDLLKDLLGVLLGFVGRVWKMSVLKASGT